MWHPGKALIDYLVVSRHLSQNPEIFSRGMQHSNLPQPALTLGFLYFLDEGGHNVEQVPYYTVVGDFEDGGFGVFVDGDDGAGAFHAHDVLDGAADSQSQVKFGGDGLAGAADLAIHGQPAGVADRTRGGQLSAERIGELFGEIDVLLLF